MNFHKAIVLILFLFPNFAFSQNWMQLPAEYPDEKAIYIDTDNIKKSNPNQVIYNLKRDYNSPQQFDEHQQYHSQILTIKVNCKTKKIAVLQVNFYDKNNLVIYRHQTKKAVWQDIGKEPAINARFNFVCNYGKSS